MILAASLIAVLVAGSSQIAAQAPPRDTKADTRATATIAGVVVADDPEARPVRHARVMLNGDATAGLTTVTDDRGRFTFPNLPAGRFTVSAAKDGWVVTAYGAKKPLHPGTAVLVDAGRRCRSSNSTRARLRDHRCAAGSSWSALDRHDGAGHALCDAERRAAGRVRPRICDHGRPWRIPHLRPAARRLHRGRVVAAGVPRCARSGTAADERSRCARRAALATHRHLPRRRSRSPRRSIPEPLRPHKRPCSR